MKWIFERRRQLLLLFVASLLAIVLAECGLRLGGISFPVVDCVDEFSGWGYQPNRTWTYREEGYATVSINSYGYRDENWEVDKPTGVFRLAVLGDSYVEAMQVEREDRFTEQLELLLAQRNFRRAERVEVMNFGIGGFGTSQELQTLRHRVLQFKPDLVLLAVLTGNDIRNNSRSLDRDDMRPYFNIEAGELVLDASFRETKGYRGSLLKSTARAIGRYSAIVQLALRIRRTRQAKSLREDSTPDNEIGLDDAIYTEPASPDWEDAWRITERLIRAMRDESVQAGAEFHLVTLSNAIQVHPDPQVRKEFEQRLDVDDLFYPDRRLQAYAQLHGIASLHLAPLLQAQADREQWFLHGFANTEMGTGHWNATGHRAAALLIADWLATVVDEPGVGSTLD